MAALEIGSDATFSMQDISVYEHYFTQTPQIIKVDTGLRSSTMVMWISGISVLQAFGAKTLPVLTTEILRFLNMTILLRRHRSQNLTTWPFKLQWR